MNINEIKQLIAVEYSVLFDRFQTRTIQEVIIDSMDAMSENRQPQYALLYIAESQERADLIITQIKRAMDPDIQKKELDDFYARCRNEEESLSDLTIDQLLNNLNGE